MLLIDNKLLIVELTRNCNSKCIHCSYWKEDKYNSNIDKEMFFDQILAFKKKGLTEIMLTGGEPLLYPDLFEILEFSYKEKLKVKLATNGILLSKIPEKFYNYINEIVISLDSDNSITYIKIREVDMFNQIVGSIQYIRQSYSHITIKCSFLLQKNNFRNLIGFVNYCHNLRIDSINILVPNSRGDFGGNFEADVYHKIFLNKTEINEFNKKYVPILKRMIIEAPSFINRTISEIDYLIDYLLTLQGLGKYEKYRNIKCSLPIKSTTLLYDGTLKPCLFLPLETNIKAKNYMNELLKLKQQYIFNSQCFEEYCFKCFEVSL